MLCRPTSQEGTLLLLFPVSHFIVLHHHPSLIQHCTTKTPILMSRVIQMDCQHPQPLLISLKKKRKVPKRGRKYHNQLWCPSQSQTLSWSLDHLIHLILCLQSAWGQTGPSQILVVLIPACSAAAPILPVDGAASCQQTSETPTQRAASVYHPYIHTQQCSHL